MTKHLWNTGFEIERRLNKEALELVRNSLGSANNNDLARAMSIPRNSGDWDQNRLLDRVKAILSSAQLPPEMLKLEKSWMCAICNEYETDYGTNCIRCIEAGRDKVAASDDAGVGISQISNEE